MRRAGAADGAAAARSRPARAPHGAAAREARLRPAAGRRAGRARRRWAAVCGAAAACRPRTRRSAERRDGDEPPRPHAHDDETPFCNERRVSFITRRSRARPRRGGRSRPVVLKTWGLARTVPVELRARVKDVGAVEAARDADAEHVAERAGDVLLRHARARRRRTWRARCAARPGTSAPRTRTPGSSRRPRAR